MQENFMWRNYLTRNKRNKRFPEHFQKVKKIDVVLHWAHSLRLITLASVECIHRTLYLLTIHLNIIIFGLFSLSDFSHFGLIHRSDILTSDILHSDFLTVRTFRHRTIFVRTFFVRTFFVRTFYVAPIYQCIDRMINQYSERYFGQIIPEQWVVRLF